MEIIMPTFTFLYFRLFTPTKAPYLMVKELTIAIMYLLDRDAWLVSL